MERLINFDPQWINDVVITGIDIFILFFDKEAEAILDDARKKAKKQEAEILEEARAEAGRILERASREIDLEKKKALEDVKTEIVSIASLMAGKAVAASMDMKLQDSLIQETLKEMGESTWQS